MARHSSGRRSISKGTLSKSKWKSLGDLFGSQQQEDEDDGVNGFEELRKHIKQGNEFTREISTIMQERSDLESQYSKNLSRLSSKLSKAAQGCFGTLAEGWSLVAVEMDAEAELHKQLSQQLHDDLYKPIKSLSESQSKTRKPIEQAVDKAHKNYMDRRIDEVRCKKNAYQVTKEREKLCEQISTGKDSKGKDLGDKDKSKLDKSSRKSEDNLRKIDKEYQDTSHKAELARQEWETAIIKANTQLQELEEERISQMQDFMNKYNNQLSVIGPKLIQSCDKLKETILSVDTTSDLHKVIEKKGTGANQPEQVLPDFYAEDPSNAMEKERRRQILQNYLIRYQQDIERETKSKEGIEKMVDVYTNKPSYGDAGTLEDTRYKLAHINATINYLEAAHYKISCAMADLEGNAKPTHPLSNYIERTKDKQGHMVSILRIPASMVNSYTPATGVSNNRSPGDGGHPDSPFDAHDTHLQPEQVYASFDRICQQGEGTNGAMANKPKVRAHFGKQLSSATDSLDDDEFQDYDSPHQAVGQCNAIYEYIGQQPDELSIRPGDVITIYDKQVDGWWQGELRGKIGIFPGSYVEENQGGSVRL